MNALISAKRSCNKKRKIYKTMCKSKKRNSELMLVEKNENITDAKEWWKFVN